MAKRRCLFELAALIVRGGVFANGYGPGADWARW
jgi:hypothetical protein